MSIFNSLLSKPVTARPQQADVTRALLRAASECTSLVDMLMLQVRCRSEEIAVCDDTSALRYSDLAEYAARLKHEGVGAGSRARLFKASGDNLEQATRTLAAPALVQTFAADHCQLLKPGGVSELAAAICRHIPAWQPARPEICNLQKA